MNDLMREEFEAWLRTRPEVLNIGFNKGTGRYVLREDEERWEAWQASRESLVIEVPELINCGEDMGCAFLKAIEAAGVKYK